MTRLADVEGDFSAIGWHRDVVVHAAVPGDTARATGRLLAAEGMAALGVRPSSVGRGGDRSPIWPAGICGSIAHTEGCSVVVVGRAPSERVGLGIDVERFDGVPNTLSGTVLTDSERIAVDRLEGGERSGAVALAFCVKEAVYKAQYPLTRTLLDFHDLELTWQRAADGGPTPHGIVHSNEPVVAGLRLCAFVRRLGPFVIAGAVASQ